MLHLLLALTPPSRILYDALDHPSKVAVVGDFNGWDAPGIKMQPILNGYRWKADVDVPPGAYRYVVLENGTTVPMGAARAAAMKWLVVEPTDYSKHPAEIGDGVITESGLGHFPDSRDTWRLSDKVFQVGFRTRHQDVMNVSIAVSQPGAEQKDYAMVYSEQDPVYDWFMVKVVLNPSKPFLYRFILDDGNGPRAFDTAGLAPGTIGGGDPFRQDPGALPIVKEVPSQEPRRHPIWFAPNGTPLPHLRNSEFDNTKIKKT
jgi:hypothetical protein